MRISRGEWACERALLGALMLANKVCTLLFVSSVDSDANAQRLVRSMSMTRTIATKRGPTRQACFQRRPLYTSSASCLTYYNSTCPFAATTSPRTMRRSCRAASQGD